jgi:hypothetical protein
MNGIRKPGFGVAGRCHADSEEREKKKWIFGIWVSLYGGIPNACFVPGNMQ